MRPIAILLIALFLAACSPSGDCDVQWDMADDGAYGTLTWDCILED